MWERRRTKSPGVGRRPGSCRRKFGESVPLGFSSRRPRRHRGTSLSAGRTCRRRSAGLPATSRSSSLQKHSSARNPPPARCSRSAAPRSSQLQRLDAWGCLPATQAKVSQQRGEHVGGRAGPQLVSPPAPSPFTRMLEAVLDSSILFLPRCTATVGASQSQSNTSRRAARGVCPHVAAELPGGAKAVLGLSCASKDSCHRTLRRSWRRRHRSRRRSSSSQAGDHVGSELERVVREDSWFVEMADRRLEPMTWELRATGTRHSPG